MSLENLLKKVTIMQSAFIKCYLEPISREPSIFPLKVFSRLLDTYTLCFSVLTPNPTTASSPEPWAQPLP